MEKEEREKEKEMKEAMAKVRTSPTHAHISSSNSNESKSPSPEKLLDLGIRNGRNGEVVSVAPSVESVEVRRRSRQPSSSASGAKKSIRQLREASREKRRENESKPRAEGSGENDMLISGLQLVKVEQANTANNTPDGTPPGATSTSLPPVSHSTPSKSNGKVDEIMQASPVAIRPAAPVQPQPPASGSAKRGTFHSRPSPAVKK